MRKFLLALLLSVSVLGVSAQKYTISGRVQIGKSSKGVPMAVVTVVDANLWAITDDNGHFSIRNVQAGKHPVNVSCLGYVALDSELNVTGDRDDLVFRLCWRRPETLRSGGYRAREPQQHEHFARDRQGGAGPFADGQRFGRVEPAAGRQNREPEPDERQRVFDPRRRRLAGERFVRYGGRGRRRTVVDERFVRRLVRSEHAEYRIEQRGIHRSNYGYSVGRIRRPDERRRQGKDAQGQNALYGDFYDEPQNQAVFAEQRFRPGGGISVR